MALEFQFAFLGPEHNYVASVTRTSSTGCPLDPSTTEFYGLPKPFCDQYKKRLALPRYIYNVRGHDFLSFVGQWKSSTRDGPLDNNPNLYIEISELQKLARQDESKTNNKRKANLIACLGPSSDAFFADAFRLRRYRWRNLPSDLEDEIQEIVCDYGWVEKGKGRIWDVAVNAVGGWVMQLDEGADWRNGGELHETLNRALAEGKKRKGVSIARLFMNHQHPTEYVLLFSDGMAYARLHEAFKIPLRGLLHRWFEAKAKRNKKLEYFEWFNFSISCACGRREQQKRIAAYYARRGMYQHLKGNVEIAHKYLRQANADHPNNISIQENYVRTLKALRISRHDPILEDSLISLNQLRREDTNLSWAFHEEQDENKEFRSEYLWAIDMLKRVGSERTRQLAKEMEGSRLLAREIIHVTEAQRGWSSAMGTALDVFSVVEMGDADAEAEDRPEPRPNVPELP